MELVLRGNSLARELEIEGVRVVARGGATLEEMRKERGDNERTIYIFGICDLWKRGFNNLEKRKVRALEREIGEVRGSKDEILCTFYPPMAVSDEDTEVVREKKDRTNEYV